MTPRGHDGSAGNAGSTASEPTRSRQPKRLVLSFLGEFMAQRADAPVRTGVFLEVLQGRVSQRPLPERRWTGWCAVAS